MTGRVKALLLTQKEKRRWQGFQTDADQDADVGTGWGKLRVEVVRFGVLASWTICSSAIRTPYTGREIRLSYWLSIHKASYTNLYLVPVFSQQRAPLLYSLLSVCHRIEQGAP